ncbi:MAG: hypothetical protein PHI16_06730, partial [Methanocellales archaeon]|nr:hypothetical protein [Methanocellales archaeon]
THPEKPMVAIAPANAIDLRNIRLLIFIVLIIYCSTYDIKISILIRVGCYKPKTEDSRVLIY